MRRFLAFGDGLPMTVVTFMICGPVLFGLGLIAFEPWRDPSWVRDILINPGSHPLFYFWLLFILRGMLVPDDVDDDEPSPAKTPLRWHSDMLWAIACGIFLCLLALGDETGATGARRNLASFIAFALTLLSGALAWRDQREQMRRAPGSAPHH